jgi:hypothetical protein
MIIISETAHLNGGYMENNVHKITGSKILDIFESLKITLSPSEMKQLSGVLLTQAVALGECPPLAQVQSCDGVTVITRKDPGFNLRVIDTSSESNPEAIVHDYSLNDIVDGDQINQETRWEGTMEELAVYIDENN